MKKFRISLIFFIAMMIGVCANAENVIKKTSNGYIDWTTGEVFAVGHGYIPDKFRDSPAALIMSRRAAIVDAQRNLLEIVKGVQVSSERTVTSAMKESSTVKTQVEGVVKGAEIMEETCDEEEISCKVKLRIKTGGKLTGAVLPRESFKESRSLFGKSPINIASSVNSFFSHLVSPAHAVTPMQHFKANEMETLQKMLQEIRQASSLKSLEEGIEGRILEMQKASSFTGILIDATNIPSFEIALSPALKNPGGEKLYPSVLTDYDKAVVLRPVTYNLNINDAAKDTRIFDKPLIIKAEGIYKKKFSDLVISETDADLLNNSPILQNLMKNCKVSIVIAE